MGRAQILTTVVPNTSIAVPPGATLLMPAVLLAPEERIRNVLAAKRASQTSLVVGVNRLLLYLMAI